MKISVLLVWLSSMPVSATALAQGAPAGEPAVIAQQIIQRQFEKEDCPLVVRATRLGDGSITATCNNSERFRVIGPNTAMRCSALEKLGIRGC